MLAGSRVLSLSSRAEAAFLVKRFLDVLSGVQKHLDTDADTDRKVRRCTSQPEIVSFLLFV